jgi:type IV secretory pathway protease TraF
MDTKTRHRGSARPSRGLRTGGLIAVGLLLGVLLLPEAVAPFVAINLTPSLPRGLYRITRLRVQTGALVTLCLPQEIVRRHDLGRWIAPGRCPGGKAPLCKRITVTGPGLAVCGKTVWRVPEGEVFIRGESRNSQDSCIFGPVPVAWLRDGVVPVWTR